MNKIIAFGLILCALTLNNLTVNAQTIGGNYKCLIQLKNYQGEGAYIVVSVVNSKGEYVETLRVLGDDNEWYPDLKTWYDFREKNKQQPKLDGITGATIGSGERSTVAFVIDKKYIDKGFALRFETAVEDKGYFTKDLSILLTTEQLKLGKYEGKEGYIRQVRLIPVAK